MAAHRYWRIINRADSGAGGLTGLAELELRDATGGPDLTGSGVAAVSTIQSGSAAAAFDNNTTTTQWQSNGHIGEWISYDFGAGNDKDIVEIVIYPNKDAVSRTPGYFDIQYSDDNAAWTTAWAGTNTTWAVGTGVVFTKPTAGAHRHWRIRALTMFGSGNTMSCAELELRSTPGGADETGTGTPTARTTFGGFPVTNVFDNNPATFWSGSGGIAQTENIAYDFGAGVTKEILEFAFTSRDDWQVQAPKDGWIESSPDGRSWMERWTFAGLAWTDFSTNLITSPDSPGGGTRRRHAAMMF